LLHDRRDPLGDELARWVASLLLPKRQRS